MRFQTEVAAASLPRMHPTAQRSRRSPRISVEAVLSLCAALGLFAFSQFHGLSERDAHYVVEQMSVVIIGALSVWGAVRAFRRHGKWNRRIGLLTLAVLLTTIVVASLLNSAAEPPNPQRIEYGE
jgi:hypothetical protein